MSFSQQIATWGTKTVDKIQMTRRGVTIKLFNAVIHDTPVDTGRARANWQIQVGEPIRTTTENLDKGGGETMAKIQTTVQPTNGDTPIFLSNNLPYIDALEKGHSKQQPAGMVRKNVARFARLIHIEVGQ